MKNTEAFARAFYSNEVALADLHDLLDQLREEESDTTIAECIEIHLNDVSHWLQEVEQAEGIDLVEEMEVYVPTNASNREERTLTLKRLRHARFGRELQKRLPPGTIVEVTEWAGCDEDWEDPVYVTAEDPKELKDYYDTVTDLRGDLAREEPQAHLAWVLTDLTEG